MEFSDALAVVAESFGLTVIEAGLILKCASLSPRNKEEAVTVSRLVLARESFQLEENYKDGAITNADYTLKGKAVRGLASIGDCATLGKISN